MDAQSQIGVLNAGLRNQLSKKPLLSIKSKNNSIQVNYHSIHVNYHFSPATHVTVKFKSTRLKPTVLTLGDQFVIREEEKRLSMSKSFPVIIGMRLQMTLYGGNDNYELSYSMLLRKYCQVL